MKYLKELKELRARVPVAVNEGLSYLNQFNGDINLSELAFRTEAVNTICKQTECSFDEADEAFSYMKQDIAKTISLLKERQFDRSYLPPENLTKQDVEVIDEWLRTDYDETFIYSITNEVVKALSHLPNLEIIKAAMAQAKRRIEAILGDVDYCTNEQEYIRRWNLLTTDAEMRKYEADVLNNLDKLRHELHRHYRNLE